MPGLYPQARGFLPSISPFKFEVSKSEIRNKFQSPKIQNSRRPSSFLGVWWIDQRFLGFEFGICFGFRVSDFGFLYPTGGVQPKSYGTCSATAAPVNFLNA